MTDNSERRIRVRLARQRSGPDRVRARLREEGSLRWWRRIPWVHVGTTVGVVGAAGGLIFTGIATYYSAKVAQEQLEQSREDSGQREREQAARVTYWMEGSFWGGTERIHVVNRSPDAVSGIQITLRVTKDKEKWEAYTLVDRGLRPCSEIVFDPARLHLTELGDDAKLSLTEVGWDVESLHFMDRTGQLWSRTETTLSKSAGRSGVGDADDDTGVVTPDGPPKIKPVDPCGSDA